MDLIGNAANQKYIESYLPSDDVIPEIDGVLAAIAYGSNIVNPRDGLIGHCLQNKLRMDLWMRYDETVPVAIPLLKKLLQYQQNNIFTKFIPDRLHSKVVWWKGYGAYIGSANHSESAWHRNLEIGVFFTDDDLVRSGFDIQLEDYFSFLSSLSESIPISPDYISEMEGLEKLKVSNAKGEAHRKTKKWGGPSRVTATSPIDRKKQNFRREWTETLGVLKSIESQIIDYKPGWVSPKVPPAWQVDQFLHAYYYNKVGDNRLKPFEEYHNKNKKDPNGVLKNVLNWWAELQSAPSKEDNTFDISGPLLMRLLSKEYVLGITQTEFEEICQHTHATKDYLNKVSTADLGRPESQSLTRQERIPLFASLLLKERNQKGWDVKELLNYVLYEGADDDMWERIFNAAKVREYSIPRYGLNSIAEVSGWARPEIAPPRNGRTSKALRALGFDVHIY